MSFDDFVISYFVTGNGVKNISIVVYNMTKRINPTINALSTIVILVIIIVLLVRQRYAAADPEKKPAGSQKAQQDHRRGVRRVVV